jgi:hypothetical protein
MQRKVRGRTHLRLEIAERVADAFMREHEEGDVDEGAAREPKDDDIGHDSTTQEE